MNAASEHVPGTRPKMALQIGEEDDASSLNASCGVCGALPIVMPYRATPCGYVERAFFFEQSSFLFVLL
jgi:hypothetical protein